MFGGKGRFLMSGRTTVWKARGASADAPLLHIEIADTIWRRFLGMMGRKNIEPFHALLLRPCSGVHMCFMRFPVDVAYVKFLEGDGCWQVVKLVCGLRPWLGVSGCRSADAALEMGKGEAERLGMAIGTVWEELHLLGGGFR